MDQERLRLVRRMDAYKRLLEITTDELARDAIEQQTTGIATRIRELDEASLMLQADSY
jgi:replicative DNA helicase